MHVHVHTCKLYYGMCLKKQWQLVFGGNHILFCRALQSPCTAELPLKVELRRHTRFSYITIKACLSPAHNGKCGKICGDMIAVCTRQNNVQFLSEGCHVDT